ncbi:hypothetical protein DL98DRAFT_634265 [Cadophora sp. DSE1049]|nr:hypothetical protein DL98DRAFT_634265 [Cadophora sp. DSE1049]
MEDLAMFYMDCGEEFLEAAHQMMTEVLHQRKTRLGKEQPFTLLAICNLARVKSALGRHIEAEQLFLNAIPIAERSLGENHFGTLAGKTHFAVVLVRQKRYTEAEEVFEKVVEKQRYASAAREDGDHPDRIFALWHLVECYELHGKFDEALLTVAELERVTETIGGSGLGKLHPIRQKMAKKRQASGEGSMRSATDIRPARRGSSFQRLAHRDCCVSKHDLMRRYVLSQNRTRMSLNCITW